MIDVSVIIPVGPMPENETFLPELIQSICEQSERPKEVVIVDDAAHLSQECKDVVGFALVDHGIEVQWIKNQWNLGEASSRNIGTINASCEWVFQASYDDKMLPRCLEKCYRCAEGQHFDKAGYYYVVLDLDDGTFQGEVGAHAMFHKNLWAYLGGYPLVGSLGIVDMSFIDLVWTKGGKSFKVSEEALYWHRNHKNNVLKIVTHEFHLLARDISNINTREWKHPSWVKGFYDVHGI